MKVLVIEDDFASLELLRLRLETLGCAVVVAESVEEGVESARAEQPQLVITDLKLGGQLNSGVSLIDKLRSDPRTSEIPIIVHSIFVAHPTDMPEALPKADGYLLKPFKYKDLKQLIEQLQLDLPAATVH